MIKLNEGQQKALLELKEFVKSSDNVYTLAGYAGTGKTTLLMEFLKFLKSKHKTPIFSAPTHRALAVLKQINSEIISFTLHKLFGLRPFFNIEDGDYSLKDIRFNKKSKPLLNNNSLLIIDEASMINDVLYEFILEEAKLKNVKIIFVGDPAQLRPVKSKNGSKVFSQNNATFLTKVERTGDNPLLKQSFELREGKPFFKETLLNEFGEGVVNITDITVIPEIIKKEFSKLNADPFHIRMLCGTNSKVQQCNIEIRKALGYTDQIHEGEILMGYDNWGRLEENQYMLINSGDYFVEKVTPGVKTALDLNFNGFYCTLVSCYDNLNVSRVFIVDNTENEEKIKFFTDSIKALNIKGEEIRYSNKNLSTEYFIRAGILKDSLAFMKDHFNNSGKVFQKRTLDYGYSHTIHKSQGGTYLNVMIHQNSIEVFKNPEVIKELRYVSLTRARKTAYVF